MKNLIWLFLVVLIGCEPETVEKIVYVRDSISSLRIPVISIDSSRTIKPQVDTVQVFEIDTVFITETEYNLDTVWLTEIRYDTIIEIVYDTVIRENIFLYPDYLQPTIDEWLERVDERGIILPYMDVGIEIGEPPRGPEAIQTWDYLELGVWRIYAIPSAGEKEVNVWRGLSHVMLNKDYIYATNFQGEYPEEGSANDNLMYQAFPSVMYWGASEARKDQYWDEMLD